MKFQLESSMPSPIHSYTIKWHKFSGLDPGDPEPGIMQVFTEDGVSVMVDFLCPCGCGQRCPTHLAPSGQEKKPNDRRWLFSSNGDLPTLSPSIRWVSGCYAHFNITDGKVIVHGDSGRKP